LEQYLVFGLDRSLAGVELVLVVASVFPLRRMVGKPVVYSWLRGERWQKLEVWVRQRGFAAVFLARTTPIIPMGSFGYVVGVSPMSFGGYALATAIASFPMTMIATGAGDFLKNAPWWV
jgi:uncharacterized membrane protein YdjX (TVP38/TMEM64 family)